MDRRIGAVTLLWAGCLLISAGCSGDSKTTISTPDTSNLTVEPLQSPPGAGNANRAGRSKTPEVASPGNAPD